MLAFDARVADSCYRPTISPAIGAAPFVPANCPCARFHALRHTHASMLLNAGADVLTVSRRLGHAKAAVTLDTTDMIEGADQAATKTIERMLK